YLSPMPRPDDTTRLEVNVPLARYFLLQLLSQPSLVFHDQGGAVGMTVAAKIFFKDDTNYGLCKNMVPEESTVGKMLKYLREKYPERKIKDMHGAFIWRGIRYLALEQWDTFLKHVSDVCKDNNYSKSFVEGQAFHYLKMAVFHGNTNGVT